ncbi:MAG: hypothetical protein L0Z62_38535, partial [Gemmataceae bacterium]|nr:hypothetical protein [Gemmataceae bacterium]
QRAGEYDPELPISFLRHPDWAGMKNAKIEILVDRAIIPAQAGLEERGAPPGGSDHQALLDAFSGQHLRTLKGHTRAVTSVCFSPDGRRLISREADDDRTGELGAQIVWDATTGQRLPHASDPLVPVPARSPDGRLFALIDGSSIRLHRLERTVVELLEGHRWVEPDLPWHQHRAQEEAQAGQWFAAAFHGERLLRTRPWDAGLRVGHAYVLARLGRGQGAARHYLQALLLNPQVPLWPCDPNAANRGARAVRAGEHATAQADFTLAAHQTGEETLTSRGDLLLVLRAAGRDDAARQTVTALLDRFGEGPENAGNLLLLTQAIPCAKAEAQRLVELATALAVRKFTATHMSLLGAALYRADQHTDAARVLESSIRVHGKGGEADTHLFLALTRQQLGQPEQARAHLARFEAWYARQKFGTWQEETRWRLLRDEARRAVLVMPPPE